MGASDGMGGQCAQLVMSNLEAIRARCDQLCEQLAEHDKRLKRLAKDQARKHAQYFVRNLAYKRGRIHLSSSPMESLPSNWVTLCGCPLANWHFERLYKVSDHETELICGT